MNDILGFSFPQLIWFIANLVTGLCYLHIPYEVHLWFRGLKRGVGVRPLAQMFQVFIALCGLHRMVMVTQVSHHPLPLAQLVVDVPMAFVSVVASIALWHNRPMIRGAFATMVYHYLEWSERVNSSSPLDTEAEDR